MAAQINAPQTRPLPPAPRSRRLGAGAGVPGQAGAAAGMCGSGQAMGSGACQGCSRGWGCAWLLWAAGGTSPGAAEGPGLLPGSGDALRQSRRVRGQLSCWACGSPEQQPPARQHGRWEEVSPPQGRGWRGCVGWGPQAQRSPQCPAPPAWGSPPSPRHTARPRGRAGLGLPEHSSGASSSRGSWAALGRVPQPRGTGTAGGGCSSCSPRPGHRDGLASTTWSRRDASP